LEIRDVLKKRRMELGLSMLDVANAVGVSEATISRWESNKSRFAVFRQCPR